MTNSQIADQFSLLSKLMDIHGENSFKVKNYSIAAFNIEQLPTEISQMAENELFGMKGIGESTGKKILGLLKTGILEALEELIANTPAGILDMMQIKGLGPKKIAVIWRELEIESIGELEYACNENRLVTLKGFSAKTQESILQSIAYLRQNEGYFLWSEANAAAQSILTNLRTGLAGFTFELAGEVCRQLEVVKTISIITDAPAHDVVPLFADLEPTEVIVADELCTITLPHCPQVQVITVPIQHLYLRTFTLNASEAFLAAFDEQYTLPEHPKDEQAIFTSNKLAFVPPFYRESKESLQQAASNTLPAFIVPTEIKGIIHSHSKWSDGNNTVEEMAIAARDQGYEYLVLSDHSQTAVYANGLKPDRIAAQHAEIDALNAKLAPFKIFKSIESDILGDGSLDYSESVLATFDLVIASVHSNLKMSEEKAMTRVMAAIENRYTTILGHPTGRLLLSRKGYPLDHKKIIDACAANNVVIEINAHPRRLDIDWRWISYAMEKGVLLSINPDAHSTNGYHDVYYGVMAAQKGGLTAAHNLSSFTLAELEAFLAKKKK